MTAQLPYPPLDPTDKNGFSYETVLKRWPIIITGVIDELHQQCHNLSLELQKGAGPRDILEAKIKEALAIVNEISKLKYEMARDRPLNPVPEDGEPYSDLYNKELESLAGEAKNTWFTAPWLYAECYLYRLLRSYLAQTQHWKDFDPFLAQKIRTFKHSYNSILQLATSMHELEADKEILVSDDKLEVFFRQMIQMSLWGNATDLSLLTHLSVTDIERLQAVGKEAQAARHEFILKDDQDAVWNHFKSLKKARVDIILDNSGFELFTDLVFADFLVTYTPHVDKVIFHPKMFPWFVSDVTPPDFAQSFELLLDPAFFDSVSEDQSNNRQHLIAMVNRWKGYVESGVFVLSVALESRFGEDTHDIADFWTSPYPYWNMESLAPELFGRLKTSDLVIFKGDLNYRKLTGDLKWPAWTPFAEALRGLAGSFPILSLRTNKADVVVGVDRAVAEELDAKSGNKWRVDGSYALISFLGRTTDT
ncbi:DUF89 domain-containing protein [Macrolepiota fuliginosa MF-IS2]|uniref:Sugar phosphate phosphatase n=1 Tax=Macrolepiota fuliginosa MF-IS2 TaxID=1400762 RepID=A0A9P6BZR2_9AGAR|nr:DUF89 domain-containing protein [Macrolepiota fuliginosa MF-IS2]